MKAESALFLVLLCGLTFFPATAGNAAEYNKPDIEVNRSVLKDLENYTPPQMFGGATSQKIETAKENSTKDTISKPLVRKAEQPSTPNLTPPAPDQAPSAEMLLDHPAQNHHVLTIQKPSEPAAPLPVPPTAPAKENIPALPESTVAAAPKTDLPPRPTHKPAFAKIQKETAATTTETANIDAEKPAAKPAQEKQTKPPLHAYKPSTPRTMPAIPPVAVEKAALPDVANLPPIEPEKVDKPSIGERLMDDALSRNMVKDEREVREVLGVPSALATENTNQFSMAFKEGVAELVADQKKMLAEEVLPRLKKDKTARIEIKAYASRTDDTESSARRISLSRALSARSYLLEKGIKPTRIDVRALSDRTAEPPVDRIDMTFTYGSAPNS